MGLDLEYFDGQTPLNEEETEGLLLPVIATRGELDEFEQQNIVQAVQWTLGRSFKPETVFPEKFVQMAHKRMCADVIVESIELIFRPEPACTKVPSGPYILLS